MYPRSATAILILPQIHVNGNNQYRKFPLMCSQYVVLHYRPKPDGPIADTTCSGLWDWHVEVRRSVSRSKWSTVIKGTLTKHT